MLRQTFKLLFLCTGNCYFLCIFITCEDYRMPQILMLKTRPMNLYMKLILCASGFLLKSNSEHLKKAINQINIVIKKFLQHEIL